MDEVSQRLRETGRLERICSVDLTLHNRGHREDRPFCTCSGGFLPSYSKKQTCEMGRCTSEEPPLLLAVAAGAMAAQLDNLNALGPAGSQSSKGQEAALNHRRPGQCTCPNGLTPADLWHWDHGVPRSERDRKPKFLLEL